MQYAYSAFANVMDFFSEEMYEFVDGEVSGLFDANMLRNSSAVLQFETSTPTWSFIVGGCVLKCSHLS